MAQGMLGRGAQGEKVRIFRDSRLRRFGGFDEQLACNLANSAVFICVLSLNYLTSEWCKWELNEFLKCAPGSRILKAIIRPVNEYEQREEIRDVLDSFFYRVNESSGLFNELRPQINKEDVADYAVRLETLAQNVVELLKQSAITEHRIHNETVKAFDGCAYFQTISNPLWPSIFINVIINYLTAQLPPEGPRKGLPAEC